MVSMSDTGIRLNEARWALYEQLMQPHAPEDRTRLCGAMMELLPKDCRMAVSKHREAYPDEGPLVDVVEREFIGMLVQGSGQVRDEVWAVAVLVEQAMTSLYIPFAGQARAILRVTMKRAGGVVPPVGMFVDHASLAAETLAAYAEFTQRGKS